MRRFPRQHVIGCTFCEWEMDISPWISCRMITPPKPVAHLLFLLHRHRRHRDVYPAWKAKYEAEQETTQ